MKTVLMVAPYFIPRRRVGALRPFKFATHLRSFGYQPVILTISSPGDTFTDVERERLKDIPIIEIEPPFDRTQKKDQKSNEHQKRSAFLNWVDKQIPLDSWMLLFLMKYSKIRAEVQSVSPDLIWATGDPWSGLWLGEKLSRRLSIPFIADFRDPWTVTEVNLRDRSAFSMRIDRYVEKKILKHADQLVFTAESTERRYLEEFKLKKEITHTIYNSFDGSLNKRGESAKWEKNLPERYFHLLFFGRFRRLSPVRSITNALIVLKNSDPKIASNIRIHSFGDPDWEEMQTIESGGLKKNFIFHNRVIHEKTVSVLKSADLLLLSTHQNRKHVIPAKLWDYISVPVPILSIAPNPEVGDIINRCKAGFHIDPDQTIEIADYLSSCVRTKQTNKSFNESSGKECLDRTLYEAKQTTEQLASLFDKLVPDG